MFAVSVTFEIAAAAMVLRKSVNTWDEAVKL